MKKRKKLRIFALALLLCVLVAQLPAVAAGQSVTILFTQDWNDQFSAHADPNGGSFLGAAYLSARVKQERNTQPELLLLDAGGFSMGTLLESIYTTHAPELDLLGRMGYDAVTLGSDAFAYGTQGLAQMLSAAQSHDEPPALLLSNVTSEDTQLREALDAYGTQEYFIIERSGVRIALFSLLSSEAAGQIEGISVEKPAEAAARIVAALEQEDYDLLVCLSRGSLDKDGTRSELALAQAVPQLDLIICGGSAALETPIQEGQTLLVSAAGNGEQLGKLVLRQSAQGWSVSSYELISIHSSNSDIQLIDTMLFTAIDAYKQIVNDQYLAPYGMSYDQLLTERDDLLTAQAQAGESLPLGTLVAQALLASVTAQGSAAPQIALVPNANLSGALAAGQLTVSDAFSVYQGARGADGEVGEGLIAFYLSGKDVRHMLEINATLHPKDISQQLSVAGISYQYHPYRMPYDRVTQCRLTESGQALDDNTLYLVVAPQGIQTQLDALNSKALIAVTARDAEGERLSSVEETILSTRGGAEFKLWYALALYLKSGDAQLDSQSAAQRDTTLSPSALFSNPGRSTILILVAAAAVLLLLILIFIRLATRKRRRRSGNRYGGSAHRYRGGRR